MTPTTDSGSTTFTTTRTNSIYDPELAEIRFSFTINGITHTLYKNITSRILPVIDGAATVPYGLPDDYAVVGHPTYFISNIHGNLRPYILQYQWEIITDSGIGYVLLYGEHTTTPVTFYSPGSYRVSLRILDGCGWSKWDEKYIEVTF